MKTNTHVTKTIRDDFSELKFEKISRKLKDKALEIRKEERKKKQSGT